jgi:hypothetical protein
MKLHFTAIALPLIVASSVAFATAPVTTTTSQYSHHSMMKHQMMPQKSMMSIERALKVVEKAGYRNIWKIELENNTYHVKGYDSTGHKVKLRVDPMTGAITMSRAMF